MRPSIPLPWIFHYVSLFPSNYESLKHYGPCLAQTAHIRDSMALWIKEIYFFLLIVWNKIRVRRLKLLITVTFQEVKYLSLNKYWRHTWLEKEKSETHPPISQWDKSKQLGAIHSHLDYVYFYVLGGEEMLQKADSYFSTTTIRVLGGFIKQNDNDLVNLIMDQLYTFDPPVF